MAYTIDPEAFILHNETNYNWWKKPQKDYEFTFKERFLAHELTSHHLILGIVQKLRRNLRYPLRNPLPRQNAIKLQDIVSANIADSISSVGPTLPMSLHLH